MHEKILLVGDNPFLGVSHLSQERAAERGSAVTTAAGAADLLSTALDNGADGFLFSVADPSLKILGELHRRRLLGSSALYAIAPWSFEYVRAAVRLGGLTGLAKELGGRVARARDAYSIVRGAGGVVTNDLGAMYEAYLSYELARIRQAAGRDVNVPSLVLHEIVGDMALGLGMEWLFRAHVAANRRAGTKPGYNTRNLPLLVRRFEEWGIDLDGSVVVAPFNAEGFQMCPTREECEATLAGLDRTEVIAFSIFAAGHMRYADAIGYAAGLRNISGVAVGISRPEHASATFSDLRSAFDG